MKESQLTSRLLSRASILPWGSPIITFCVICNISQVAQITHLVWSYHFSDSSSHHPGHLSLPCKLSNLFSNYFVGHIYHSDAQDNIILLISFDHIPCVCIKYNLQTKRWNCKDMNCTNVLPHLKLSDRHILRSKQFGLIFLNACKQFIGLPFFFFRLVQRGFTFHACI